MQTFRRKIALLVVLLFACLLLGCMNQKELVIEIRPPEGGTVTPPSGTIFERDTIANLTVDANEDWVFVGWSGPHGRQVIQVTDNEWLLEMNTDKTIGANFRENKLLVILGAIEIIDEENKLLQLDPPLRWNRRKFQVQLPTDSNSGKVRFKLIPLNPNCTIKIDGDEIEGGQFTEEYLVNKSKEFLISVYSENGGCLTDYKITITCSPPCQ